MSLNKITLIFHVLNFYLIALHVLLSQVIITTRYEVQKTFSPLKQSSIIVDLYKLVGNDSIKME